MKKDLSVLSFSANRTFFWIVLYLAAFSVSQLYLFDLRLNDPKYAADPWVVFNSWFALSIGMALIILSGIPSKGSRYEYRLRLLRISERRYFMLSTLYNIAVFILVWLTESAVLSIAVRIYERSASFTDGPQGIFARLGSSPFLQRFILLDDVGIFISTIAAMIAFGIAAGYFQMRRKTGKISILVIIMYAAYFYFTGMEVRTNGQSQAHNYIVSVSIVIFIASLCMLSAMISMLSGGSSTEVDDEQ